MVISIPRVRRSDYRSIDLKAVLMVINIIVEHMFLRQPKTKVLRV